MNQNLCQCSLSCGHSWLGWAEARVVVGAPWADIACGAWTEKGQGALHVMFKLFAWFIIRTAQDLPEESHVLASLLSVCFYLHLELLFLSSSTPLSWAVCVPLTELRMKVLTVLSGHYRESFLLVFLAPAKPWRLVLQWQPPSLLGIFEKISSIVHWPNNRAKKIHGMEKSIAFGSYGLKIN